LLSPFFSSPLVPLSSPLCGGDQKQTLDAWRTKGRGAWTARAGRRRQGLPVAEGRGGGAGPWLQHLLLLVAVAEGCDMRWRRKAMAAVRRQRRGLRRRLGNGGTRS
jgi:hypothetical protein